jgi:hypothetical protein
MRKIATWVLIPLLAAAMPLQALEPHPMKVWLMTNKDDHISVDEKKAPSQARKKMFLGAITGGLAAGARAALLHEDVARALVGGAIAGGAAGYFIGHMQDRKIADRTDLARRVAYDNSQGYRAEVTDVHCDPCRVKPGQKFAITVHYWAMAPQQAPLTLSRHLGMSGGGSYIRVATFDPDPFAIPEGGGEFETTLEYAINNEGTFTIEWLVENGQTSLQAAKSADITVTNAI